MHPNEIADLMSGDTSVAADRKWPPDSESAAWERIADHRRRYENDAADLFRHRTDLHIPGDAEATAARAATYNPVGLARDLARFSAQLLFSEPPKLKVKGSSPDIGQSLEQTALQDLSDRNDLEAFLFKAAVKVASEGSGAIRIISDGDLDDGKPVLTFEAADRVIWSIRQGRVVGGVVVVKREFENSVYRLLEEHGAGYVRRRLYRGSETRLGHSAGLTEGPYEFRDLDDEVSTSVDRPTLIRWLNSDEGQSDISGVETTLDALDEAASVGGEKLRASKPRIFVNRRLANDSGVANLEGCIFLDDAAMSPIETPDQLVNIVQTSLDAQDHVTYMRQKREEAITASGYSLASWGMDHGGSADSGKALKLRQARTLQTRAGKERVARKAISEACAVALELGGNGRYEIEVQLADGMPRDTLELAEELATLKDSGLISDEQALRRLHPEWTEDQIKAEAASLPEATGTRSTINSILSGGDF